MPLIASLIKVKYIAAKGINERKQKKEYANSKNNKFAVGDKGEAVANLFIKTSEMQKKIDEYFTKNKVWKVQGLGLALGFCATQSLIDYSKKSEVFNYSIKRANED